MPMLRMPEVPVKYAGQQTAYLLHNRYVARVDESENREPEVASANHKATITW
jgi:hypothetical protein